MSLAAANTPLLCKAPRYIDQNSGSSTETVPLAQDPLMILNENEFKTHKLPIPIVPLREAVQITPDHVYQINFEDHIDYGFFSNFGVINYSGVFHDYYGRSIVSKHGPFRYWDPNTESYLFSNGSFIFIDDGTEYGITWYWDPTSESYINLLTSDGITWYPNDWEFDWRRFLWEFTIL